MGTSTRRTWRGRKGAAVPKCWGLWSPLRLNQLCELGLELNPGVSVLSSVRQRQWPLRSVAGLNHGMVGALIMQVFFALSSDDM